MKNKIIPLIIMLIIFNISLVIADDTPMQNQPYDIKHSIRVNGGISTDITANITVKDPDNFVINQKIMSFNVANQEHNATLPSSNTTKLGIYDYCITSTNGILNSTDCFDFEVTITGDKADTSESITFFIIGILSLVFFMMSLFGAIKIPFENQRNSQGFIMSINDLKYVKILLWFVSYLLLIFISFAFTHASRLANWDTAGNFLNFIFWFLISFLLPVFAILFISVIMAIFNDKKIKSYIDRNLRIK